MSTFTAYSSGAYTPSDLVSALLANAPGITIVPGSASFGGSGDQISFYDGSLAGLGAGAGLLLTSGNGTPSTANADPAASASVDNGDADESDADLEAALAQAGMTEETRDATYLQFSFTVTDPNVNSITFDLVFGSEEFPDYVGSYVDIAGVFVNNVNYALFNNDPSRPLSVLQRNIDSGQIVDNTGGSLPIEYNGVSVPLSIVAPVRQGLNTIKIAIADTRDEGLDSGLFVSNLRSSAETGGGIVLPQSRRQPDAVDDAAVLTEDRFSLDGRAVSGNVLANDAVGASAAAGAAVVSAVGEAASAVGQAVQGRYGTLVLRADGSYTYTLSNTDALIAGEAGVERFAYAIATPGGLSDTAVLEIRVQGEDLEILRAGAFSAHRGADRIGGGEGEDRLAGRAGDDVLAGLGGDDLLWGEEGNDTLLSGEGADQAVGGAGDDVLWLGAGDDHGWGEAGSDAIHGEAGDDRADGGADDDRLELGAGEDRGWGGEGADALVGGAGEDRLSGGSGDDAVEGQGGSDRLWGGSGSDVLEGGSGSDQFNGGEDDDRLVLDGGSDTAWGGAGADVFVAGAGADVVKDFQDGDRIDLSAFFRSFAALESRMEEEDGDVVIDLPGGGNTLTIERVGALDKGDFLF